MNVESWCKVEANSSSSWLRANRKHFPNAMKSDIFKHTLPDRFEEKGPKVRLEELSAKKHFPGKCELIS